MSGAEKEKSKEIAGTSTERGADQEKQPKRLRPEQVRLLEKMDIYSKPITIRLIPGQGIQERYIEQKIASYSCPISAGLMKAPVTSPGCKHTFEKAAIKRWADTSGRNGCHMCPVCKENRQNKFAINIGLQQEISRYKIKSLDSILEFTFEHSEEMKINIKTFEISDPNPNKVSHLKDQITYRLGIPREKIELTDEISGMILEEEQPLTEVGSTFVISEKTWQKILQERLSKKNDPRILMKPIKGN